MAKVNLGPQTAPSMPQARGSFLVRLDPRLGTIAQAWPKKRGTNGLTPYRFYTYTEFGIAAHWASNTQDIDIDTGIFLAKNSQYVWRDILIKAMYGNLYEFRNLDGTIWTRVRDVAPNAQLILDLVTTTPGSIIYRDIDGWHGLGPTTNGYVLSFLNGQPLWIPSAIAGGTGTQLNLFTANGIWAKPAWAQRVKCILLAGGGGGGSGGRQALGVGYSGGSGGGGGAMTTMDFDAIDMNPTETIVIPAAALGGLSRTTDNATGLPGGSPANVTMTTGTFSLRAQAGTGGNAAGGGSQGGGPGGAVGTVNGIAGAAAGTQTVGSAPGAAPLQSGGGGASGAGRATTATNLNGGAQVTSSAASGLTWTPSTGGIASTKTNPGGALLLKLLGLASMGGGGGWAASDGTAGPGGDGGAYGGGGGGGGSSLNGNLSGKGGNGASGAVLVVSQ